MENQIFIRQRDGPSPGGVHFSRAVIRFGWNIPRSGFAARPRGELSARLGNSRVLLFR